MATAKKKITRHRDALKKARQSEKRRLRNKAVLAEIKTLRREALAAAPEAKAAAVKRLASALQKAAQKKILHRNRASRLLSRVAGRK